MRELATAIALIVSPALWRFDPLASPTFSLGRVRQTQAIYSVDFELTDNAKAIIVIRTVKLRPDLEETVPCGVVCINFKVEPSPLFEPKRRESISGFLRDPNGLANAAAIDWPATFTQRADKTCGQCHQGADFTGRIGDTHEHLIVGVDVQDARFDLINGVQ